MSDTIKIERRWHPEYWGYVWQPVIPGNHKLIEPFVRKKEAEAFVKGYQFQQEVK